MKIGIFGGTFNPVHLGHILAAQSVREACGLDLVLFVPAAVSPFKVGEDCASPEDRLEMLRLAVGDDPCAGVSGVDIARGGVSYAIDTVREIQAANPGATLYFIVGADCASGLYHWREARALLEECVFTVMTRPGSPLPCDDAAWRLPPPWPERLRAQSVEGRMCDISSSEIRSRVASGRTIRNLVPRPVEDYIAARGLYRPASP